MRPIPSKIRKQLADDHFMRKCIYKDCPNQPEWEHAFIYSGKQVNETWAIVPVCTYHHRLQGLDKQYNQFIALERVSKAKRFDELKLKYPRFNWEQTYNYLKHIYGE